VYKALVPNQRAQNQVLIAFALDKALLDSLDTVRRLGGHSRSHLIRLALAAELSRRGHPLPAGIAFAPDRAGKGGPTRYPAHLPNAACLNEPPGASNRKSKIKNQK
jgi:hypothetical protein